MSAFVVGVEHIDLLIGAGLHGPGAWHGGPGGSWNRLRWNVAPRVDAGRWREWEPNELNELTADRVGLMLWDENRASVEYRYPDTAETGGDYPGPIGLTRASFGAYTFTDRRYRLTAVETLSAIACYEYQSCETARERGPIAGEVIATWRRASDGSTFVRYFYGAGNAVRVWARSLEAGAAWIPSSGERAADQLFSPWCEPDNGLRAWSHSRCSGYVGGGMTGRGAERRRIILGPCACPCHHTDERARAER